MRASLTAVAVAVVALSVGCSQPVAPTGPTSLSPATPSIASSDANATGAGLLTQGHEVPFKGRWEGALTARTPLPPGFLSLSFEGTGNATHLGRFTVEIRIVLNTTDRTLTGTYEFTAANGDTVTAAVTGQSPLMPPGVPQTSVETATITGGTGRFASASGSFTAERVVDLATFLTTGSFNGTISSPGAVKP
jgi:hypothetical protein